MDESNSSIRDVFLTDEVKTATAICTDQSQNEHIEGDQLQTEHIEGDQSQTGHIEGDQLQTEHIEGDQSQTEHIEGELYDRANILHDDQHGNKSSQYEESCLVSHHGASEPIKLEKTALNMSPTAIQQATVPGLNWNSAPEVILISVFRMLPVLDRLVVFHVCRHWRSLASTAQVWFNFDYGIDEGLTIRKNLFDNPEEYIYRHIINAYGEKFRSIQFALFCDKSYEMIQHLMKKCTNLKKIVIEVIYRAIEREASFKNTVNMILCSNCGMEELQLKNVNFYSHPNRSMKDPFPVGATLAMSLHRLTLISSFRDNNMTSLMHMVNLKELTISPQQLEVTWLTHLVKASLRILNIVGEAGMWERDFNNLTEQMWREISGYSRLQVNCYLKDFVCQSQLLCCGMPLHTLVCNDQLRLDYSHIPAILAPFSQTLTVFVDVTFSQKSPGSMLVDDDAIIGIVQTCGQLKSMAIKSCLHSSTLLLMAQINPSLTDLMVREDMIVYSLHLPTDRDLPQDVIKFTLDNFMFDRFQGAMVQLLKCQWAPLSVGRYMGVLSKRYNSW